MRQHRGGRKAAAVLLALGLALGVGGEASAQNTHQRLKLATPKTTVGKNKQTDKRQAVGGTASQPTREKTTTDERLRDRMYDNVVAPGTTNSTEPLTPAQDQDQPPPERATEGETLQILGSEHLKGVTAYSVNDADLLLDSLTPEQRRFVRVIPAGQIGNPHDIVLVDDAAQFNVTIHTTHWHGGYHNDPYWYGSEYRPVYVGGYYYTPRFYWAWDHASWWGFPSGGGYYYPPVTYSGDRWYVRTYPGRYWGWPYYYWYDRYWGPIDGIPSSAYNPPSQPGSPGEQATVELTGVELGMALLRAGDLERAILALRGHLAEDAEDYSAMRVLGATLLENREYSDGFAMIRLAYGSNPSLADEPMDAALFETAWRLRELVRDSVRAAYREPSSSAWLAVAMLMQAEGRDDVALKMVKKARDNYLSEDIALAMEGALTR
ncbi:MAG: hypothetical protein R3B57_01255 [Phycisphaerales bacterium]